MTLPVDKVIFACGDMVRGMIFDIKRYAIHDGPGIRTAVFFKGCPLRCWWCHNPEGQSQRPQLIFRENRCKDFKDCVKACPQKAISWDGKSLTNWERCDGCGKCAEVCFSGGRELVGRSIAVCDLIEEIKRDTVFYNQSSGGVTFTGGEPMLQKEFLRQTLIACRDLEIHTTVDTSGYASWKSFETIYPLVDLFLYDLKLMDDSRHVQYTSVSNRLILSNLKKLSKAGRRIIVRIPLIPGINDKEDDLTSFANFLSGLRTLEGVELMPYHEIGLAKYQSLGIEYKLGNIHPAPPEQIKIAEEVLIKHNLPVIKHISGRNL